MLVEYYGIINVFDIIDVATCMKCDFFKDVRGTIYEVNTEVI